MPIIQGFSPKSVSKNIKTEKAHDKPQDQAVAIALHTADQAKHSHTRECVESQCPANLSQARQRVSEAYDQKLSDARAMSHTPGTVPTKVPAPNLEPQGSGRDMSQSGLINAPQNVAPPPTQNLKVAAGKE